MTSGARLIVMCGLPGAGKSTLAEDICRALSVPVLSVDPIEAALLRSGIATTSPLVWPRMWWRKTANSRGGRRDDPGRRPVTRGAERCRASTFFSVDDRRQVRPAVKRRPSSRPVDSVSASECEPWPVNGFMFRLAFARHRGALQRSGDPPHPVAPPAAKSRTVPRADLGVGAGQAVCIRELSGTTAPELTFGSLDQPTENLAAALRYLDQN